MVWWNERGVLRCSNRVREAGAGHPGQFLVRGTSVLFIVLRTLGPVLQAARDDTQTKLHL